ncbi:MAG: conjugal transfer protein TraX [Candidatus Thiodiazotropha sp. (ex Dulcina madagascariensis)]|nr:conjugal transfer protein TraX [Candidatus Thiodiazotropha sp. (ex Dulcina madagascariensis)]
MLPEIKFSNGTLEALKWVGLVAMTGDHINKYLFNATLPALYELGRLALPIFVFVLAYNLAHPWALENGAYIRTIKRLLLFGALASVPYIALGGVWNSWWPLNILFTLLVATVVLYLIEKGTTLALVASGVMIAIGGGLVEFWWPAVIGAVAVWAYCKRPSTVAALVGVVACASLVVINKNWWALAAIPVIATAALVKIPVPRMRWVFYVYYPLHLAALWLIRIPMSRAGYIFF